MAPSCGMFANGALPGPPPLNVKYQGKLPAGVPDKWPIQI